MTTANIQPLPCGAAVFELRGMTHMFPTCDEAVAETRRRGITPNLLPLPQLPVEVLATSPALRVLA